MKESPPPLQSDPHWKLVFPARVFSAPSVCCSSGHQICISIWDYCSWYGSRVNAAKLVHRHRIKLKSYLILLYIGFSDFETGYHSFVSRFPSANMTSFLWLRVSKSNILFASVFWTLIGFKRFHWNPAREKENRENSPPSRPVAHPNCCVFQIISNIHSPYCFHG